MVFLDPCFGRELGGYKARPVVVVSIDDIQQKTRMVVVVPGTTTESNFANVARVDSRPGNGLTATTYFQSQNVRSVDQGRMTSGPLGRLSEADFEKVLKSVRHTLGLLD